MTSIGSTPVPLTLPKIDPADDAPTPTFSNDSYGDNICPSPPSPPHPLAPFTLALQEDKANPGQFQLVVKLNKATSSQQQQQQHQPQLPSFATHPTNNTTTIPLLDRSASIYSTKSAATTSTYVTTNYPTSPTDEKQSVEWSDLDGGLPPRFLQHVGVPEEWNRQPYQDQSQLWKQQESPIGSPLQTQAPTTLSQSQSQSPSHPTTSTSKLAGAIKAKIKKSGKGFVVRLLRGGDNRTEGNTSRSETTELEVHLASNQNGGEPDDEISPIHELDSTPLMQLDSMESQVQQLRRHISEQGVRASEIDVSNSPPSSSTQPPISPIGSTFCPESLKDNPTSLCVSPIASLRRRPVPTDAKRVAAPLPDGILEAGSSRLARSKPQQHRPGQAAVIPSPASEGVAKSPMVDSPFIDEQVFASSTSQRTEDHWVSDAETLMQETWQAVEGDEERLEMVTFYDTLRNLGMVPNLPKAHTRTTGLSIVGPARVVGQPNHHQGKANKLSPSSPKANRHHIAATRRSNGRLPARAHSLSTVHDSTAPEDSASEVQECTSTLTRRQGRRIKTSPPGYDTTPIGRSIDNDLTIPTFITTTTTTAVAATPARHDRRPARGLTRHSSVDNNSTTQFSGKRRLRVVTKGMRQSQSEHNSPSNQHPHSFPAQIPTPRRSQPRISPAVTPTISSSSQRLDGISLKPSLKVVSDTPHASSQAEPTVAQLDSASASKGAIPLPASYEVFSLPPQERSRFAFFGLALSALTSEIIKTAGWLQERYGSEPPVADGQVRVRWTCHCGEPLYDDFIEVRPGSARMLEAFLNRPHAHANSHSGSSSPISKPPSPVFSLGGPSASSTFTSLSACSPGGDDKAYSPMKVRRGQGGFSIPIDSYPDPKWLLTCANEGRYAPKIVHLDVNEHKIRSDKDLATALRAHYDGINNRRGWWFRWLRLRGLTTIDFAQFEVHRNRFADIRKIPDMPTFPSNDYDFVPGELIPPVGSRYLLHLFKHPEDYDNELITYLRAPKRRDRLLLGQGWGLVLVEGFQPDRLWTLVVSLFALGSMIFAIIWAVLKRDDVQGAFGVASWMVTLAAVAVGWAQACLE